MTTATPDYNAISARIKELNQTVYNDAVKQEALQLLESLPPPAADETKANKVRCLLLRAKAQLLLPVYKPTAEADLNALLKLDSSSSPEPFLLLAECQWRKNSTRDALETVEHALQLDNKNALALALQSRLLRSMAAEQTLSPEERRELLNQSVEKSKAAVAANVNEGEAWLAHGLALLQYSVGVGLDMPTVLKSVAAFNMAAKKCSWNPDVYYNRAVSYDTLGRWGDAYNDYKQAVEMDPATMGTANTLASDCKTVLAKFQALEKNRRNTQYPTGLKRLPQGKKCVLIKEVLDQPAPQNSCVANLLVTSMLASSAEKQPIPYYCLDRENNSCILLLYRMQVTAIKAGDIVTVPFPPSSAVTMLHKPKGEEEVAIPTVVVEPDTVLVNGTPIPPKEKRMAQFSTRLF